MSRAYHFIVAGEKLGVSASYWDRLIGPKPPSMWECDGCSNSPDNYLTVTGRVYKLWPACVIHDWAYRTGVLGGNAQGRWTADRHFRTNMNIQLKLQGAGGIRRSALCWLYWGRVRIWGAKAYRVWDEGEEPLSLWQRVREVYGLFKSKRP